MNHQLKKLIQRKQIVLNCQTTNIIEMRNMSHGFDQRIYAHLTYKQRVREQRALRANQKHMHKDAY